MLGKLTNILPGRTRRSPLFPQLEMSECGAACLGIVLAHFDRWAPMEELRAACNVSRDGASAADIVRGGQRYGLNITGWRRTIEELPKIPLPAVLFWDFNHFLILEGVRHGRYYLNDPANGHRVVSEETISRSYTGVVLQVEPGPSFQTGGSAPSLARMMWPWLREARGPLAFAALCGLLLALPGLALPLLLSIFVDHVLTLRNAPWGTSLAVAAAIAGVSIYLLTWLQQINLRRLAIRLSVLQADRFLSRLFRLPTLFFSHRHAGDITSRLQLIDGVAAVSSSQFVGIAIELVMSVLFLAVMLYFDPLMGAAVAALGVVNLLLMRVLTSARKNENRQLRREQAMLLTTAGAGLRNMESIRATASENDFFSRWTGYQARELVTRQRLAELGYVITSLPALFVALSAAVALGLGGWRVINGDMTLGTLTGFYVVAGLFLQPIGRLVQSADAFQILEADLQRINDIASAPVDEGLEGQDDGRPDEVSTLRGRLRLAGKIEMRDVTFGYRPNHPPLIENLNLTIEPGQRVAVVGTTGSGKSTLVKLLSGEFTPWSGEILFDGVPRGEIPRRVLTNSVGVVDQQIFLFAATVRDNLTMWNPTTTEQQLITATRDAQIHADIMGREAGYDSVVGEGGANFSGGQRQRFEIARALVNDPSVLLLDEATSTLDAVTEVQIDDSLRRRGVTCLIVAHRLSAIRDCDQIIVLHQGRAIQRGTHEELMADQQGTYAQLMQAN